MNTPKALTIALIFNMIVAPLVTTTQVYAAPDYREPRFTGEVLAKAQTAKQSETDAATFKSHIGEVNYHLTDLLNKLAAHKSQGSSQNIVLEQIIKKYLFIRSIYSVEEPKPIENNPPYRVLIPLHSPLTDSAFQQQLAKHIVNIIRLATIYNHKKNGVDLQSYRIAAPPAEVSLEDEEKNSGTRDLALSLTAESMASLLLLPLLGHGASASEALNQPDLINRPLHELTLKVGGVLATTAATATYFDPNNLAGISILLAIGAPTFAIDLFISKIKPYLKRTALQKQQKTELAQLQEILIAGLQSLPGNAATPIIDAIRSGNIQTIHSAACEYNLTPVSPTYVRVDINEQAEAEEIEVQTQQQRRHEL